MAEAFASLALPAPGSQVLLGRRYLAICWSAPVARAGHSAVGFGSGWVGAAPSGGVLGVVAMKVGILAVLFVLLALWASVSPARAAQAPHRTYTTQEIKQIILNAFAPLGPSAQQWALRVAKCESGYNPNAVNPSSHASGLFQFIPSTWASTPQAKAGKSVFDPVANAQAAAWLYQRQGSRPWVCK